jgi:GAF domain-containing protein
MTELQMKRGHGFRLYEPLYHTYRFMIPKNETDRINAINRYEILDTPPDGSFERLSALAAKIFNVPIAIISIVDHDRIWFKSHHGLEGVEQIDREPGLCASAILSDEVYVVEDARNDPRTLANPLVAGAFGLRFYAAAPLVTKDGYNLGTVCIIDKKQRYITEDQKTYLSDLAEIVMDEMELRLSSIEMARLKEREISELKMQINELKTKAN